jgi:hypothetical protein
MDSNSLKRRIGPFTVGEIQYLFDRRTVAVIDDGPRAGRLGHLQTLSRDIDGYHTRSHLGREHYARKSNRSGTKYRDRIESGELQLLQTVECGARATC